MRVIKHLHRLHREVSLVMVRGWTGWFLDIHSSPSPSVILWLHTEMYPVMTASVGTNNEIQMEKEPKGSPLQWDHTVPLKAPLKKDYLSQTSSNTTGAFGGGTGEPQQGVCSWKTIIDAQFLGFLLSLSWLCTLSKNWYDQIVCSPPIVIRELTYICLG